MQSNFQKDSKTALSVSQLNREARFLLEDNFPSVLVEGEISNIATPASGHWYFTLKDDNAQIRCAMFRNRNQSVRFKPINGAQVQLKAKLSLYEGRGDYQLIVERMEALGDGALRQAFEQLKLNLMREGLFDEINKQALPALPKHIGVITSPTGAAIKDIISVLNRRFPAIAITILPVSVQGENAAPEMINALKVANLKQGCLHDLDLLLIGRGGGSLEDLWSFNDEDLAHEIFASQIPIISAVGHEVDFTIADFVADVRAATPSAAAELLSPEQADYFNLFDAYQQQFAALVRDKIAGHSQQLTWLSKQLRHPGRRLLEQAQKLDDIESRLKRAAQQNIYHQRNRYKQLHSALQSHSPKTIVKQHSTELGNLKLRLKNAIQQTLLTQKQFLKEQAHALNTVSPLSTLSRGYSIAYDQKQTVIRSHQQVKVGDEICTSLHEGEIISSVKEVKSKNRLAVKNKQ